MLVLQLHYFVTFFNISVYCVVVFVPTVSQTRELVLPVDLEETVLNRELVVFNVLYLEVNLLHLLRPEKIIVRDQLVGVTVVELRRLQVLKPRLVHPVLALNSMLFVAVMKQIYLGVYPSKRGLRS